MPSKTTGASAAQEYMSVRIHDPNSCLPELVSGMDEPPAQRISTAKELSKHRKRRKLDCLLTFQMF